MAPNRNLPKHLFLTILAIISFCDYLERIQLHGVIDNLTTSTSTNSQTAHSTTCYNSATAYERDSNHDIALALLVEKCHSDTDSTISSSSYVTGDEETRKQDWLSSCYPIEISSSARSIGHCTGILLLIRRCRFIYSFRWCKVIC